jgi:4,5-dihydroxyphthalate decarboxylase
LPKLPLTLACWNYDRTRPLMDGRVQPDGIDLDLRVMRPREAFPRMLKTREFHASEMSLASYVSLKGEGNCPFVAIPVALSKIFRHDCIYVRPDAGIKTPRDLKGKRVGAMQYASTGVVYIRGFLQHDYDVQARDLDWFIGGLEAPAPAAALPSGLPRDINVQRLPATKTLSGMLATGELDALISLMHTVVIREEVHAAHPWAAKSLYQAFCKARDLAIEGLYDTDALHLTLPFLIDHVEETWRVFGKDFWSYGLAPNRPALAAVGQYVLEQHLSPRPVMPEELFVEGVEA